MYKSKKGYLFRIRLIFIEESLAVMLSSPPQKEKSLCNLESKLFPDFLNSAYSLKLSDRLFQRIEQLPRSKYLSMQSLLSTKINLL